MIYSSTYYDFGIVHSTHYLRVPTAYVWVYTARLVTGQGLPSKVPEWAFGAALVFSLTTVLRIWLNTQPQARRKLSAWIPGGIAVAVGKLSQRVHV